MSENAKKEAFKWFLLGQLSINIPNIKGSAEPEFYIEQFKIGENDKWTKHIFELFYNYYKEVL